MNPERGRVFVDSMREASRLAREASQELRVCMAVLDRDDPVEQEVYRGVAEDSAMLREMASRLSEAIGEGEAEE